MIKYANVSSIYSFLTIDAHTCISVKYPMSTCTLYVSVLDRIEISNQIKK